jgi:hypothetical protein
VRMAFAARETGCCGYFSIFWIFLCAQMLERGAGFAAAVAALATAGTRTGRPGQEAKGRPRGQESARLLWPWWGIDRMIARLESPEGSGRAAHGGVDARGGDSGSQAFLGPAEGLKRPGGS